jgi:hypothetical protein
VIVSRGLKFHWIETMAFPTSHALACGSAGHIVICGSISGLVELYKLTISS